MSVRRVLLILFAIACLIGTAQGAFAHDYWDLWTGKLWQRGDPGSTKQVWDFNRTAGPHPSDSSNPYGEAVANIAGAYTTVQIGPDGTPASVWNTTGIVDLIIPNSPIPNPKKLIYVQITSDHYTMDNADPIVSPGAYSITTPGPIIQHPYGTWYTYNWLIEIRPNPTFEDIHFDFPEGSNISQIVVDTICVPEPSSLAALAAFGVFGGVFTLRRRKR